jgi:hypothetical protein
MILTYSPRPIGALMEKPTGYDETELACQLITFLNNCLSRLKGDPHSTLPAAVFPQDLAEDGMFHRGLTLWAASRAMPLEHTAPPRGLQRRRACNAMTLVCLRSQAPRRERIELFTAPLARNRRKIDHESGELNESQFSTAGKVAQSGRAVRALR